MKAPNNAKPLPFPVRMQPYLVGQFKGSRSNLRDLLGAPHYVETDSMRTSGGDEDNWGWEFSSGLRILLVLCVPYQDVLVYCDPPDHEAAQRELGLDREADQWEAREKPFLAF